MYGAYFHAPYTQCFGTGDLLSLIVTWYSYSLTLRILFSMTGIDDVLCMTSYFLHYDQYFLYLVKLTLF